MWIGELQLVYLREEIKPLKKRFKIDLRKYMDWRQPVLWDTIGCFTSRLRVSLIIM